jgi:hypothetical protein
MANEINLSSFPGGPLEALTMLYLQNQDLTGKTPEELLGMYWETYEKLKEDGQKRRMHRHQHGTMVY